MSLNNIILLSGRPENGNTQMLIAYANMHPASTLYISLACTHELLLSKGLKPEVVVIDKVPLKDALIDNYETICIDYLEVGNKDDIKKFILKVLKKNKKVILASWMKRYGKVSDIFEEISEDRMFSTGIRKLTPEIHERLKKLNEALMVVEKQLYEIGVRLDAALQYEIKNSVNSIVDYDLELIIECYNEVEDAEPLCILRDFFDGISVQEKRERRAFFIGDDINHNVRAEMLGEHHCWLYHCIYDHTILSWEEIASISHIAVDIKPMYQYDFELTK